MPSIYYDQSYSREEVKAILGRVIKKNNSIADPTFVEYRQAARKCCGDSVCRPREQEFFSREVAILCYIAHCKKNRITPRLIKDCKFEGFPEQKAKKFAEKFGVYYGEITKHESA